MHTVGIMRHEKHELQQQMKGLATFYVCSTATWPNCCRVVKKFTTNAAASSTWSWAKILHAAQLHVESSLEAPIAVVFDKMLDCGKDVAVYLL